MTTSKAGGEGKFARVEAKEGTVSLFINGKLERDWNGPYGRSHTQFDDLESAIDDVNAAHAEALRTRDDEIVELKADRDSWIQQCEDARDLALKLGREGDDLHIGFNAANEQVKLLSEKVVRLSEELEGHAWEISPAMAQAKIDELNAKIDRLTESNRVAVEKEVGKRAKLIKDIQEVCDDTDIWKEGAVSGLIGGILGICSVAGCDIPKDKAAAIREGK